MTRCWIRSVEAVRTWADFEADVDPDDRHACLSLLAREVQARRLARGRTYEIVVARRRGGPVVWRDGA